MNTTEAATESELEGLRRLNRRFIHNFVTNDVASHDAILHASFRALYPGGVHIDRQAYLRSWRTGFDPAAIPYWDMRDQRITVAGDTALVGATNKWIRVRDGIESTGMTCYTDTYIRTPHGWLCVLAQLTPVTPENHPGDDTIVVKYLRGVLQDASA
ncbi:nuclear transport factor 2 family protein [Caenimonas sedimenti]|uniref:Nuclear transport factor 2 family protein n=1 Tax=Caenimonas sedimenti TaxID=2596921 RepID=A0A562ZT02_9BURK|nr:nuclear transport factor 2 family protein [Caenimonas sedimenti]TWO71720.1 nuclear transport factor 2 family protein [Caenimonas sedimenti]